MRDFAPPIGHSFIRACSLGLSAIMISSYFHTLILPCVAVVGVLLGQHEGRTRYGYLARKVGEAVYDKMRHNQLCGELVEADLKMREELKGVMAAKRNLDGKAQGKQEEGLGAEPVKTKQNKRKAKAGKAAPDTAGTCQAASLPKLEKDYQLELEKVGPP